VSAAVQRVSTAAGPWPRTRVVAYVAASAASTSRPGSSMAAARARHSIAVAESIGLARTYGAIAGIILAGALIEWGRWDEATSAVEHTLDHTPTPMLQVPLVCLRATIALARGDAVPAEQALAFTHAAVAPGSRHRWIHGCRSGWRPSCGSPRAASPRWPW
jgi:hypothetical protein